MRRHRRRRVGSLAVAVGFPAADVGAVGARRSAARDSRVDHLRWVLRRARLHAPSRRRRRRHRHAPAGARDRLSGHGAAGLCGDRRPAGERRHPPATVEGHRRRAEDGHRVAASAGQRHPADDGPRRRRRERGVRFAGDQHSKPAQPDGVPRLGDRHARLADGDHRAQRRRALRPHLGGAGQRRRPDLRSESAAGAVRDRRAVSHHSGDGADRRLRARQVADRIGAPAVYRDRAGPARRLHAQDRDQDGGPAGRTGRIVQLDDREHRGSAAAGAGKETARRGTAHRARDSDVAAAAGAADDAGLVGDRAVRPGARSRRRLLRLPAARRPSGRRADCRRLGQRHLGGALHGGAEGTGAVAQRNPHLAPLDADRGQPHHRRAPGRAQLHHHDLRGHRHAGTDHDLRAGRSYAADLRAGLPRPADRADSGAGRDGGRPQARSAARCSSATCTRRRFR